jgi:hypothetical protein
MKDIIKRSIINLHLDKINYDDKEEVMRIASDLKKTIMDLSQEIIEAVGKVYDNLHFFLMLVPD